jgi:transposase
MQAERGPSRVEKMSHRIAKRFAGVAIEDLNVGDLARGDQAKAVHDAAWA